MRMNSARASSPFSCSQSAKTRRGVSSSRCALIAERNASQPGGYGLASVFLVRVRRVIAYWSFVSDLRDALELGTGRDPFAVALVKASQRQFKPHEIRQILTRNQPPDGFEVKPITAESEDSHRAQAGPRGE